MMTTTHVTKKITLNRKGMITIPIKLREKYHLHEGSEVNIIELDGIISVIPIVDPETLRITPRKAFAELYRKQHEIELELEK